jgi:hypothetical protein
VNDPALLTALITAGGTAIAVVLGAIGLLLAQQRAHAAAEAAILRAEAAAEAQRLAQEARDRELKLEIGKVHEATNSMKDELVESVTAAALKKGFREALDLIIAQLKAGTPVEQISQAAEIAAAAIRYDAEAATEKARNKAAALTALPE